MLQKTVVNIPLTGGLDTKTAPNLVRNDKMALIQNARFIQGANGAKQKRNGYLQLGQRDSSGNTVLNGASLATYNNQMLAFDGLGHAFTAANGGSSLYGIGETAGAFQQSGLFNNFAVSEVSIAKDLTSYSSPDSATCNGVTAYAYLSGTTINVRIVEEATGIIYYTQVFSGTFSSPRVVTDGTYLYVFSVSSVGLQSIKITPTTPQNTLALVTVDASATGTACEVCYIPSQGYFAVAYQIGVTSSINLKMSIVSSTFAIVSSTSPTLTVSFTIGAIAISLQSSTGSTINICVAFSPAKVGVTSTAISVYWFSVTAGTVSNGFDAFYGSTIDALIPCITLVSGGGSNPVSVFWQLEAQPDGTLRQIQYATTTPSSSALSPQLLIRNTAIAAAGFVQGGQMYLPVVFESTTQQNYFLLQVTGGTAEVVSGAFMPDDAGSFPTGGVLPTVNLDVAQKFSGYLIPSDSQTLVHVNGSDLNSGTANTGPVWTKVGSVPFNPLDSPIPSVGPFGSPPYNQTDEFTLPSSSPMSFGNVNFSVTVVLDVPNTIGVLNDSPIVLTNYQSGDPNGFALEISTDGPINCQVSFALGSTALIFDNIPYGQVLGSTLVVSVGYQASTQTMYLQVNGRSTVIGPLGAANVAPTTGSQLGNFIASSLPNFPLPGNIYEVLASTAPPSSIAFAEIYNKIVSNIANSAPGKWSVALPKYTQLESVGGAIQYVTGIVELVMDFTQTRVQGVQLGQSLVMTGPLVREFDGETIVEQGFCNYPDSVVPVLLNDYGLGVATVLGTNTPTSGIINISFPSINNGSADTNLGSGQKFDGQLFIPPSTTNGYGTYFLLSSTPNTNNIGFYAVWFNVIGQGLVDPTTTGGPLAGGIWNPIPVTINATDSTATIVQNTYQAISGSAFGVALLGAGGTITQAANLITITAPNVVNETALIQPTWRSQFSIYNLLMQESGDTQIGKTPTLVKLPPGNVIVPGSYFINNGYVFWFSVDGVGTAPVGTGLTTVQVSIASTDPENTVAFHFWQAILPLGGYVTNSNPYPYLIIFWTQDAASIGYGTMLSSGIGISDGSGTPGAYATDAYQYSSIYERIDTAGQLHRSEPAVPVTIGIPSWGGGGQNSFYAVALVVPNLQLTNTGGIGIIGYRTTANSTLLFRFTPVNSITMSAKTADSTILYDHTTDAALNGNELLYTTGGIFGNDQAPPLSFLCVHQDRMWGISDEDPTLLYFTKQFSGGLEVAWSLEQTVRIDPSGGYAVSMASMDGNLIVFAQTRIWVISGAGPDDAGNGAFNLPQLVSSAVGCRDPFSVVLTPDGLIFKSSKGFYLLDRSLNAEEMPAEEAFNSDVVTAATLIPNTTEIRFLSSSGTTQLYDYFYKEWGSFTNHQGLDACIWNGVYCYLRTPSTVSTPISIFQENPQPVNVLPTDNGVAFPMVLTLNWIKGADIAATAGNAAAAVQSFGRIWKSLWKGNFQGIMQVTNAYDYANSPQPSDSHLIGGVGSGSWGSDPTWGSSTPWGGSGSTTAFYQFKCYNRNQLCEAIQLTIQDVAPYCYWSLDALALEVGIRKGAYKRLGVGQST